MIAPNSLRHSYVQRMERVQHRRAETVMALARLKARMGNLSVRIMGVEPWLVGIWEGGK